MRRGKGRVEDNESEYIFSKISHMSLFGFRLCLCIFVGVWVCGCVCPGGCEGGREGRRGGGKGCNGDGGEVGG